MVLEDQFNLQGTFTLMDITIKRSLFATLIICLCLFSIGCSNNITDIPSNQVIRAEEEQKKKTNQEKTVMYDLSYYITSSNSFRVSFMDYSSIKEPIEDDIQLSENEKNILIENLKLCSKGMTKDVFKTEFSVYYIVKLNNVITIEIDASPLRSYGDNTTYMIAHLHQGKSTCLYGSYVDSSIIDIIRGNIE